MYIKNIKLNIYVNLPYIELAFLTYRWLGGIRLFIIQFFSVMQ